MPDLVVFIGSASPWLTIGLAVLALGLAITDAISRARKEKNEFVQDRDNEG